MTVCHASREEAAARRRYAKLHEEYPFHDGDGYWSAIASPDAPYHRDDGTTIFVTATDLGLGGDFLVAADAAGADVAEGDPGDE